MTRLGIFSSAGTAHVQFSMAPKSTEPSRLLVACYLPILEESRLGKILGGWCRVHMKTSFDFLVLTMVQGRGRRFRPASRFRSINFSKIGTNTLRVSSGSRLLSPYFPSSGEIELVDITRSPSSLSYTHVSPQSAPFPLRQFPHLLSSIIEAFDPQSPVFVASWVVRFSSSTSKSSTGSFKEPHRLGPCPR